MCKVFYAIYFNKFIIVYFVLYTWWTEQFSPISATGRALKLGVFHTHSIISWLLVFVLGDVNFAPELSDLRYRHHMYVIVIHPTNASYVLLSCAHEHHCFQELVADVPERQLAYQVSRVKSKVIRQGNPWWSLLKLIVIRQGPLCSLRVDLPSLRSPLASVKIIY